MQEISSQNKKVSHNDIVYWYLLVFVLSAGLYFFTCAPTVLWQDSALYVYRMWHNDIEGNLGLALAHPLYIIVGMAVKYIPVGEFSWRANLTASFFGAVAVANLFLLLRLWSGRIIPAIIGAITLAVSWTFWQHAVIAEVDTLCNALIFAELIALTQYARSKQIGYLYLLGIFNGLSLANHMWGSFGFACYTVFLIVLLIRRQIRLKHFGITVLLWVIFASPYEYLVLKHLITTGDLTGTLASAAFGALWKRQVLNTSISIKIVFENIIFILLNFPTPNLAFLFVGLWTLPKAAPNKACRNIIFALLIAYLLFAFRYTIPYRHAFFLPFYLICSFAIGLGVDAFLQRYKSRKIVVALIVLSLLPILVYCVTPSLGRRFYKSLRQRRQRPYRNEYTYFLQPWQRGYYGAERFASEALNVVEKDAVIHATTTDVHALLYVQEVQGLRSDVKIVSTYDMSKDAPDFTEETIESLMSKYPVYVVSPFKSYCPDFILDNYDTAKVGVVYRVVERQNR